jgi:hypothetical protein
MSTLQTINDNDLISASNEVINDNFDSLNTNKIETDYLDTDTTLAANSDTKIPTQKAVKAYVDSGGNPNASETTRGIVEEATDAEVTAGTATGSTGAKLFVTPAKIKTRLLATEVISSEVESVVINNLIAKDLYVVIVDVTATAAGGRRISFSSDNGSTFGGTIGLSTGSTAARTGWIRLDDFGTAIPYKPWTRFPNDTTTYPTGLITDANVNNAIKIDNSSGNLTGGTIYVYGK